MGKVPLECLSLLGLVSLHAGVGMGKAPEFVDGPSVNAASFAKPVPFVARPSDNLDAQISAMRD